MVLLGCCLVLSITYRKAAHGETARAHFADILCDISPFRFNRRYIQMMNAKIFYNN